MAIAARRGVRGEEWWRGKCLGDECGTRGDAWSLELPPFEGSTRVTFQLSERSRFRTLPGLFTCAGLSAGASGTSDRTTDLPDLIGRNGVLGVGRQHRGERADRRLRDLTARPTDKIQDRSRRD